MSREIEIISDFSQNNSSFKYLEILSAAMTKNKKDKTIPKKIKGMRDRTLYQLAKTLYRYSKEGFLDYIIFDIAKQKIEYILNAKSKTQMEQILKHGEVRYDGNHFVPLNAHYHVEQEEMIMWSMTSLKAPLNSEATARFVELVNKYVH